MKTSAIVRICIWSLVALLLIATMTLLLVSNTSFAWPKGSWSLGISGHRYPNASEYVAGNAEISENVRAIDLHWISGSVKVVGYDGEVLRVTEQASNENEDIQLHWRYKNGVLYIQPCASKWFFGLVAWGEQDLTVEIPYSMLTSFTSIEIDSVSAPVILNSITANALTVDTVSGNITVSDSTAEIVELGSVSGRIETDGLTASTVDIDLTSGNADLDGTFHHIKTDAVSGSVKVRSSIAPLSAEFDAVSGDITLYCPLDDGFTLALDTVSGKFDCDYPIDKRGSLHISGNGTGNYEADTVSGDLYIRQP